MVVLLAVRWYGEAMTNSWMNEDGEPIMDGAAWRFEQQLDMDSADDYAADHFYDEWDEDEEDDMDDDFPMSMEYGEDSWLDGSYEE